jgi:hypothetical protein
MKAARLGESLTLKHNDVLAIDWLYDWWAVFKGFEKVGLFVT